MRFGILGALSVTDAGHDVAVTAGRDRVVLAILLLHPGRIVSSEDLIDAVWEDGPPATARGQLQTCISRLRRALPAESILTDPAGYGIRLAPEDLDAEVFGRLVTQARAAADAELARKLFREALGLWQGPALAGLEARAVRQRAAVLDEQHAVAIEDWVDLELAGGRDRDLVAELTGLVEQFPLRERLRAQLMRSLYRVGRQADALGEYRRARELLRNELGIEPGTALQELHRRILEGAVLPDATVRPEAAAVRCLPRTVSDFTGRQEAVHRLRAAAEPTGPGPVTLVVDGMAGSGKTTLALHVAGLVGHRYPDAHLFLDLQGHSEQEPLEPGAALLALLRQLGVPAELIPAEVPERVTLWRTELSRRRVLVVLDNAASSAQVIRLLPTSPDSLTLITSRRRLAGLDGVHPESLPVLDETEAVALLARIAGSRVAEEPAAALEVARRCGLLPLAIRLAGARLAHRPRWRVADLLRRLGESALPELAAEDRTVASAFALSYQQLREAERRVFRLLGLQPGERFGAFSVAALADLPLDHVRDLLDALIDMHLVEEPEPDVFRLHDLLRQYAVTLAAEIPADLCHQAVVRLLDFHLHAFAAANEPGYRRVLVRDLELGDAPRPDLIAALPDPAAHLERERPYLAGLVDAGVAAGRPDYAWSLPRAAWRYLFRRGYIVELGVLLRRGLDAAREAGDVSAMATTANYLASVPYRLGQPAEARALLEMTLQLRRRLGDKQDTSVVLGNLAVINESTGRFAETIELSQQALVIGRQLNNMISVMQRHYGIATGQLRLGDLRPALRHARLSLLTAVDERDVSGLAAAMVKVAVLKRLNGWQDIAGARRMMEAALRLNRASRLTFSESITLHELALLARDEGRLDTAVELSRQAVALAQRVGYGRSEALYLCRLGETLLTVDRPAARETFDRALTLADSRYPYERAVALHGRAEVAVADGDPDRARRHWREALELFTRTGVPERHDVARRLAELDSGPDQLRTSGDGGRMEG